MNSLFLEERPDDDLLFKLECASIQYNLELQEINFMLEMCDFKEKHDMNLAEFKVYAESGTDDDLEYMYGEILTESGEERKGVFAKLWGAICDIFKAIKDAISGLFSQKSAVPEDATITVNAEEFEAAKKGASGFKAVMPKVIKAVAITGGAAATLGVAHKIATNHADKQNPTRRLTDGSAAPNVQEGIGADKAATAAFISKCLETATSINKAFDEKKSGGATKEVPVKEVEKVLNDYKEISNTVIQQSAQTVQNGQAAQAANAAAKASDKVVNMLAKAWQASMKRWSVAKTELSAAQAAYKKDPSEANKRALATAEAKERRQKNIASAQRSVLKNRIQARVDAKRQAAAFEPRNGMGIESADEDYIGDGDPTFESGAIDDIMDLINSL